MVELKPCPFCGHTPAIEFLHHTDGEKWGAVCCCCNGPEVRTGYGPVEEWRDAAIKEWNTLPIEDAQSAEIERLRARVAELESELAMEMAGNLNPEGTSAIMKKLAVYKLYRNICLDIKTRVENGEYRSRRIYGLILDAMSKEVGHDG